jgi:hypothetical protein
MQKQLSLVPSLNSFFLSFPLSISLSLSIIFSLPAFNELRPDERIFFAFVLKAHWKLFFSSEERNDILLSFFLSHLHTRLVLWILLRDSLSQGESKNRQWDMFKRVTVGASVKVVKRVFWTLSPATYKKKIIKGKSTGKSKKLIKTFQLSFSHEKSFKIFFSLSSLSIPADFVLLVINWFLFPAFPSLAAVS